MKIGILAIQGDFELHRKALSSLSVDSLFVRSSKDLDNIRALILPGGESTTMSLLMNKFNLFNSFIDLNKDEILSDKFYATFIRGPRFSKVSKDCKVIGHYKNEPVLIRNDKHLISSFHPEIGKDLSVYKYFINMINE